MRGGMRGVTILAVVSLSGYARLALEPVPFPVLRGPYLGQEPPGPRNSDRLGDSYWIDGAIIESLREKVAADEPPQ